MTTGEAASFGWDVVASVLPLVFFLAVALLGLGLLHLVRSW